MRAMILIPTAWPRPPSRRPDAGHQLMVRVWTANATGDQKQRETYSSEAEAQRGSWVAWLPASGKGARPLSRPHARHGVLQAVDRHIQINVYVARRNEDRVLLLLNRLQPPDAR